MSSNINNNQEEGDKNMTMGPPEGVEAKYFLQEYKELLEDLETLSGEMFDKIFEISGKRMSPPESEKIVRSWLEKGDEGFEWMRQHLEEAIMDVAYDIQQIVQEELDYNYPEGETKTGDEETRING